jgi:hypothetical protein
MTHRDRPHLESRCLAAKLIPESLVCRAQEEMIVRAMDRFPEMVFHGM